MLGTILMNLKGLVPFSGLIIAAVSATTKSSKLLQDGESATGLGWTLPLLNTFGVFSSVLPMFFIGRPYDGFVKAMSIPHLLLTAPSTIAVFTNVFIDKTITYEHSPVAYVWGLSLLAVFGVSNAFDIWDTFEWYVLKTRKVLRWSKHVEEWEKGK